MINSALRLAAYIALVLLSSDLSAEPVRKGVYCYSPCKSELSGRIHVKDVILDDPKLRFTAYILRLNKPISVSENDLYEAVSGERRIQLQFEHNIKSAPQETCIDVVGELAGAETASDIYPLVMRVDSYSRCK